MSKIFPPIVKDQKTTKHEADYRNVPKGGERCDKCTMFRRPEACTAVGGAIAPSGWCRLYEAKALGKAMNMDEFQFFLPIAKMDEKKRTVSGYASTPTKDSDGEIVTLEAIRNALPGYMEYGNIREMHALKAVGTAEETHIDMKGLYLTAKIVDDAAWKKCQSGVYKGFSIGGRKLAKEGNKINEIDLTEISVVDRPANPDCRMSLSKSEKLEAGTEGYLVKVKRTKEQKVVAKLTKVMEILAKADNPPAARDGFSLPAPKTVEKTEGQISPRDKETQNNKAEGEPMEEAEGSKKPSVMVDDRFPLGDEKKGKKAKKKKKAAEAVVAAKFAKASAPAHFSSAFDLGSVSFGSLDLVRKAKVVAEPVAKSMGTAGTLSYVFDSIRSAQRSLMMEGKREGGDKHDQQLAKELGALAKQLAGIIGKKAEHEGAEAIDLTDADDKYITSMLNDERLQMTKVNGEGEVEITGDPLLDLIAKAVRKAGQPTRAQMLDTAKGEVKKARKAMKECREAIEEAHKMHKAAYISKMEKAAKAKKPDADGADDDFDHLKCMEKLKKAHSAAETALTMGKAAVGQLEKAEKIPGRSGQRGQETGDALAGFYEVPPGVRDLSPSDMATASPGGGARGSAPPAYPDDGSVYAGKGEGVGDLTKFAKNGMVPTAVMELLVERAAQRGELEALRRVPARAGGSRPFAFDLTKANGAMGGGNPSDLTKTLFDGVDVNAIGSGDEQAHVAASARVIGNYITSGKFGKSVFDPGFKGTAGLNNQ